MESKVAQAQQWISATLDGVSKKTQGQGLSENTAEVFGLLPTLVNIC